MNNHYILKDRKLQCRVVPVTRARQNCSIIWCTETRRAAIVDPGGDLDLLRYVLKEEELQVERLLVTHGHPDHAGGATDLSYLLEVPIEGPHVGDKQIIGRMPDLGELYGFEDCMAFEPVRWFHHGDEIVVGNQRLRALHCPGHTEGHIAYFSEEARIAFVGDILFKGAVGATKKPENHLELLRSIRLTLFPLGDDVVFVPGHQQLSTFGEERRTNPVVSDQAAQRYQHLLDDPRLRTDRIINDRELSLR
jgi:hydroxyacylglutathione hydrolase